MEKKSIWNFPEQSGYLGKAVIIAPKYKTNTPNGEIEAKVIRDDKKSLDGLCMIFQLEDEKCLFNTEVYYYRLKG
jgi:hypothetical protein